MKKSCGLAEYSFILCAFAEWYRREWHPWLPPQSKWHHFRVQSFDGKWFKIQDKRIRSKTIFKRNLFKAPIFPPRHVYYSALTWLDPKNLGPKKMRNYCLGGPLIFDIDIMKTKSYGDSTIREAKRQTLLLTEILSHIYGFRDFSYVFSGKRGFHVYVNDFDVREIAGQPNGALRENLEKKIRSQIAKEMDKRVHIDVPVTTDVRRIVRLPRTLHGGTGFLSSYLASKSDLEKFELQRSIVFSMKEPVQVRIVKQVPRIEIGDFLLDLTTDREFVSVPLGIAVFLALSNFAILPNGQNFYI